MHAVPKVHAPSPACLPLALHVRAPACTLAHLHGACMVQEVPFRVTRLDPLSPQGTLSPEASGMMSPVLSPLTQAPINLVMASSPVGTMSHHAPHPMLTTPGILHQIDESGEHAHTSPPNQRSAFSDAAATPASRTPSPQPAARPSAIHTGPSRLAHSHTNGSTSSGGGGAAPPLQDHIQRIRAELGDGEGVTALLHRSTGGAVAVTEEDLMLSDDDVAGGTAHTPQPTSPTTRLRHDTYGATLEFMDTLCEASASLASIAQVRRRGCAGQA